MIKARLAEQSSDLERQGQNLSSKIVEQAREQEKTTSLRRIQELQLRLEQQVERRQARRTQPFQEPGAICEVYRVMGEVWASLAKRAQLQIASRSAR